jgi:DNA polymerase-3 subunit epsilon
VSKPSLDAEVSVLRTEMIYLSDIEPRLQTLTAISRFSSR